MAHIDGATGNFDNKYIRRDGTSTTTGSITFSSGLVVKTGSFIASGVSLFARPAQFDGVIRSGSGISLNGGQTSPWIWFADDTTTGMGTEGNGFYTFYSEGNVVAEFTNSNNNFNRQLIGNDGLTISAGSMIASGAGVFNNNLSVNGSQTVSGPAFFNKTIAINNTTSALGNTPFISFSGGGTMFDYTQSWFSFNGDSTVDNGNDINVPYLSPTGMYLASCHVDMTA